MARFSLGGPHDPGGALTARRPGHLFWPVTSLLRTCGLLFKSWPDYPSWPVTVAFRIVALGLAVSALVFSSGLCAGCLRRPAPLERTEFMMDTVVTVKAFGASQEALSEAFDVMRRVDALMNRYSEDSDIGLLNLHAGREPVRLSDDTMECLEEAIRYAKISDGAFDPTLGPLIDLWGIGKRADFIPSREEIERALKLRGIDKIVLDPKTETGFLKVEGMKVDLGGIAKGFAVDRAALALKRRGIRSAIIDAGGNVYVIGKKPDGSEWRVGIRHPRKSDRMIAVVEVSDTAVVTSGDYQRYFEKNGVRYHHIFDPATGEPARKLISCTIICPSSTRADALSTAVFVLGPDLGMDLVERLPDVEAVLVTPRGEVLVSSGLKAAGNVRVLPW
ncbi:MAG TPA: FAD:protein FMN transferase [Clostridia bacterium]|nr:FAD:protein FMN transferase [Clostridia bacterium]